MKRFICVLLVCTQLAACTSLSTVPYGEGAAATGSASPIARGDQLRIAFREGGEKRVKVTSASANEICAEDGCIRTAEIAGVERVEVALVPTLLGILAAALLLAALASSAGGMASGFSRAGAF